MIRLLITDDEQIERDGMQLILTKNFPELIIEQARNGNMAAQMAKEFKPDLILMDIKMPGMNGLEAVEQIAADDPGIKFIMVTAYDTFDFMRQAIKFGVKDYLLKPSKAADIVMTIGKVLKEIEEEKKSLESSRQEMQSTRSLVETDAVTQLLFHHVHDVRVDQLIEILDIQSADEMFAMIVLLPDGEDHFYPLVKEKVRQTGSGWVGALNGNQLPVILFRKPGQSFRAQASTLARDILSIAKSGAQDHWFVGIGNVYGSLDQIRQSYKEALMAAMDTAVPSKFRFYSDVPVTGDLSEEPFADQQEKELSDQVRRGEWQQVRTRLMNLIQHYENKGTDLLQSQQRMLEVLWIGSRVMREMGIETITPLYSYQTYQYRQLRSETDALLDRMKQTYASHNKRTEADTIHQIKQYIIDHSNEDMSLDTLATKVGLSPIYISKMFKEKLGINYIDLLTECRIEKAKKLLGNPEKSIKEITYEVGYHDPNYFSKVFKKVCRVSPKEYRKEIIGKANW
ncbi:response regulator [Bacillus sp. SJS]|uniref:response regulator n=1 Tax=Bacillus sp. SJS TaxID=1423321 RepID=UPI0004DCDA06|nr:response regulator [Bacillus sp. SJS]KZZ84501.1 DNA-binding response regulator [Bacillus sp. SJS]